MSVSDRHGGGLTLQRVIGADLDRIDSFIHVDRFANDIPPCDRFASKCLNIPALEETDFSRGLIGLQAAHWLHHRGIVKRIHAQRAAFKISRRFRASKKPAIGLVCPQGQPSLYCMDALSRFTEIKYFTWIMDDHWVTWNGSEWAYRKSVERLISRHLRGAKRVFTISPEMRDFYSSRFGVTSDVLFGPAEATENPVWHRPTCHHIVKLGYFGAIGPWQIDALAVLAERLQPVGASLDVYTASDTIPDCLKRPGVKICARVAAQHVTSVMRTYDAVVIPASFEERLRNLSHFNIATKMSECLASGTITLLVAPEYAAMSKLLQSENAAIIVSHAFDGSLRDAIERIRNEAGRVGILRAAERFVRSTLSPEAMRRVWLRGTGSTPSSSLETVTTPRETPAIS